MSETQQFPLAELARFQRGVTWSKAQEIDEPEPGAVPVLRIPNIKERLDTSDLIYLRGVKKSSIDQCAAAKDWVLMVGSNGNPDRVGNCVLIKETNEFLFASFLVGIEPTNRKRITPDYLFRVLRGPEIQRFISDDVQGSTGLSNINWARLKAKAVACPPLPQQRRIAEILSTLDEAIEQTETLIAKHQQIKAGLMHDLFTRGVTVDGHLRPTREQAPDLYKESPLGWIPREWGFAALQEIVNPNRPIVYGILMPGYGCDGGVPVVKVKDIRGGTIDESKLLLTSPQIDQEYRRSRLQPGDILLTIRGSVGRLAVVPSSLAEANITQDTARISIQNGNAQFYRYFLETSAARRHFEINTLGVAVQGINLGEVRKTLVPVTDLHEQDRIANRIDDCVRRILCEQLLLEKLRKKRVGLMHDLLTGRVRVSNKENCGTS